METPVFQITRCSCSLSLRSVRALRLIQYNSNSFHPIVRPLHHEPSLSTLSPVLHVLRRLGARRTSSPALRRPLPLRRMILQRHSLSVCLRHYILPVLKWLCEVADRAHDVVVAMDAERNHWNEAKCKPRIALDHSGRPIALNMSAQKHRCLGRRKVGHTQL